jgi:hypothetical protein
MKRIFRRYIMYSNSVIQHRLYLHIPELRRDLAVKERVLQNRERNT